MKGTGIAVFCASALLLGACSGDDEMCLEVGDSEGCFEDHAVAAMHLSVANKDVTKLPPAQPCQQCHAPTPPQDKGDDQPYIPPKCLFCHQATAPITKTKLPPNQGCQQCHQATAQKPVAKVPPPVTCQQCHQ